MPVSDAADADASERRRLDVAVERATDLTKRTLALFPVRVWRHFLQNNGFLLAAGVSYQALFAIFAAIYLAFAIAGLWLGGSTSAVDAMIALINGYIPDLIHADSQFLTPDQVRDIAQKTTGVLGVTGLVALVIVIWTAIGWVTFSRRAVRDIFGLAPDRRSYIMLKARDLLGATIFGLALIAGSLLSSVSAAVLKWILDHLGWDAGSSTLNVIIRVATVVISFALLSAALASMVRFLTGTSLRWRTIWPGALLGGGAMTVLQFGAGFLLSYTPTNPLLATFAIFVGLLLWFRVNGVVMLVAAAWIAVSARDHDLPLLRQTERERIEAEYQTLLLAARIRLREARQMRDAAPWYLRWQRTHTVRSAEAELADLIENPPQPTSADAPSGRRLLTEFARSSGDVSSPR